MSFPPHLDSSLWRFTRAHEWLQQQDNAVVRVGITAHAQAQLGDVVFVDLPTVGKALRQGEVFGTVESVKAVSDLFSPVSGEIVAVNPRLTEQPELVNSDCYGAAWMVEMKLTEPQELANLMSLSAYEELVASL